MESEVARLRKELKQAHNHNNTLMAKIAQLRGLTEETQDTQNFLRHRERQMRSIEGKCNRYAGAIRAYLQSGRRAGLEEALEPHPEDEWRLGPSRPRGRYNGQAESG